MLLLIKISEKLLVLHNNSLQWIQQFIKASQKLF